MKLHITIDHDGTVTHHIWGQIPNKTFNAAMYVIDIDSSTDDIVQVSKHPHGRTGPVSVIPYSPMRPEDAAPIVAKKRLGSLEEATKYEILRLRKQNELLRVQLREAGQVAYTQAQFGLKLTDLLIAEVAKRAD